MRAEFMKQPGSSLPEGGYGIGWGIANLANVFKATYLKSGLVPFGALDKSDRLAVPFEVGGEGQGRAWVVTLWFRSLPPEGSDDIWGPGTTVEVDEAKFQAPQCGCVASGTLWVESDDGTGWPVVRTRGGDGWPDGDDEAMALLEPAAAAVWEALVPHLAGK